MTTWHALVEHMGMDVGQPQDANAMELALLQGSRLLGFPQAHIEWACRDISSRGADHIGHWRIPFGEAT